MEFVTILNEFLAKWKVTLKCIIFTFCSFEPEFLSSIRIEKCNQLIKLQFTNCSLDPLDLFSFCTRLPISTTRLGFVNNGWMKEFVKLVGADNCFKQLVNLNQLNVSNNLFLKEDKEDVMKFLQCFVNAYIYFDGNYELSTKEFKKEFEERNRNKRLEI